MYTTQQESLTMDSPGPVSMLELPRPKIEVIPTKIQGCFELRPKLLSDGRGYFGKIFHRPLWQELGLCVDFEEEYVSWSAAGALRGLHFQLPPMHHHKVVTCLRGDVLDVAVDLRRDSPTYGEHVAVALHGTLSNALYLPSGLAHGFYVTGSEALLYYKVSSVYSPAHDSGIRWDSAGIGWPTTEPILSERDQKLGLFSDFESPFTLADSVPQP
jgi:dTDP-4-dehydrorhamnose 3,5-epimerase